MAKDPAFLFYTGDFSTGTQFFSDEQLGKYVRLLMAQHQLGHLHEKHMIQICKTHDKDVFDKFVKDENGLYYNIRLENEIIKRKNYSESRSENRKNKNISKTHEIDMENKDKNRDKDNNTDSVLWVDVKKSFYNDFRWKEKFCNDKNIPILLLEPKMRDFISDIELKEDFKDLKELKRHFVNWYKVSVKISSNGHSTGRELSTHEKAIISNREMAKGKTES